MSLRSLVYRPIDKDDISRSVRVIVRTRSVSPIMLQQHLKLGYTRANRIIAMLQGAGIVTAGSDTRPAQVIIKDEEQAVNAALRRFNKGKRSK